MDIQLTEEQKDILKGKICPYCHIPSEYKSRVEVYGEDYGMIYYCPKCGAYVGVHRGTNQAKGRLANVELRRCKIEAHRYFDEIYKRGLMKRTEAYEWLSKQLGLPPEYTHIGMFNRETCAKVVDVSKKILEMRFALRKQEKIKAVFGDETLYLTDTIAVAKRVEIVRAADVFSDYELKIIRDVLKPQKQQCYRNAHLLCQLFPERVRYCEGKTNAFIPIDHAFNRVGDKYVDITFEFALNDPDLLGYEYVVFGEYDLPEIERMTKKTGYYGDIYRLAYMERRTPDAMK